MTYVNVYRQFQVLSEAELRILQQAVLELKEHFQQASVIGDADWRKGYTIASPVLDPILAIIRPWLEQHIPLALSYLMLKDYPLDTDVQLTMYGQGGYFKAHRDVDANAVDRVRRRVMSFIYYFQLVEPQAFYGGALRLFDTAKAEPFYFDDIMPVNNSAVFFRSDVLHEVMPVYVPEQEFRNNRFTINGWLLRPES